MKILLVHKFFHVVGGAETFVFETAKILKKQGHQVAFFSMKDEKNLPDENSEYFVSNIDFHRNGILKAASNFFRIIYSFEARSKMERLLRDFKPDVVHCFAIFSHISPSILDVCRNLNIPVVMSCNDFKHICSNSRLFYGGKICESCKNGIGIQPIRKNCCNDSFKFSLASTIEAHIHKRLNILRKNIDLFLFSSDFIAKKTEEFWGANSFKWKKLVNPYNSPDFPYSEEYDDYCLFFGRLVEEKGIRILLKAMGLVPNVRLKIIGDGPDRKSFELEAKEHNLVNVEFVGPQWNDDLYNILARTRFVIVPSIWNEVFGYVNIQAFSFGKAVIGSSLGAIPELINNGQYGLVYPAQDHETLAKFINILWNDPKKAMEMGKRAKLNADKEYNYEKYYETLMDIYRSVKK